MKLGERASTTVLGRDRMQCLYWVSKSDPPQKTETRKGGGICTT